MQHQLVGDKDWGEAFIKWFSAGCGIITAVVLVFAYWKAIAVFGIETATVIFNLMATIPAWAWLLAAVIWYSSKKHH